MLLSLIVTACSKPSPLTTKSLVTTDGYTYVYDHVAPHNDSMPTFLLLHGYPASRYYWHHQIQPLTEAGFGIIAPDNLGFGDSSKPTAIKEYNLRNIADHIAQILDAENLPDVIGVGHDWGAGILSRCAVFQAKRFNKLVFISVGYTAPGIFFDVDAINEDGLKNYGYTPFGYWYFFNSYDTAGIISQNLESFFHLLYPTDSSRWGTDFAQITAARAWLAANKTTELPPWLSAEDKATFLREYSQPNVTISSLNYYKALLRGVQAAGEASLTDEDRKLKVPVLGIAGADDLVTLPGTLVGETEAWAAAGFEERIIQAGHWVMLEKPDEVSQILVDFANSARSSV
ncbi:Alpha/Beta hydrolase protein [Xylaria flabelliformis]|nr:Alpha/Beta hydrolase protein [Xylaria flabelliformis]